MAQDKGLKGAKNNDEEELQIVIPRNNEGVTKE